MNFQNKIKFGLLLLIFLRCVECQLYDTVAGYFLPTKRPTNTTTTTPTITTTPTTPPNTTTTTLEPTTTTTTPPNTTTTTPEPTTTTTTTPTITTPTTPPNTTTTTPEPTTATTTPPNTTTTTPEPTTTTTTTRPPDTTTTTPEPTTTTTTTPKPTTTTTTPKPTTTTPKPSSTTTPPAKPKQAPAPRQKPKTTPKYMVSIQLYSDDTSELGLNHLCDGAVISPRRVLTAAHCVFRPNGGRYLPFELVVVVGIENVPSEALRTLDIAYIKSQGAYRRGKTLFADLAYLILKNDIPSDDFDIDYIELTSSPPKEEQECFVMSWKNSKISNDPVTIRDETFCKQIYGSMFIDGMICVSTKKSDSCPSDSGGPLICNDKVAGVASWGMDICGADTAGVYTDVTRFKKWLSKGVRLDANYFVIIFVVTIVLKSRRIINV